MVELKLLENVIENFEYDMEHGVAWMNDQASADFAKKFPHLLTSIVEIRKRLNDLTDAASEPVAKPKVEIGRKFTGRREIHFNTLTGDFWETLPAFDTWAFDLQAALLRKPRREKAAPPEKHA